MPAETVYVVHGFTPRGAPPDQTRLTILRRQAGQMKRLTAQDNSGNEIKSGRPEQSASDGIFHLDALVQRMIADACESPDMKVPPQLSYEITSSVARLAAAALRTQGADFQFDLRRADVVAMAAKINRKLVDRGTALSVDEFMNVRTVEEWPTTSLPVAAQWGRTIVVTAEPSDHNNPYASIVEANGKVVFKTPLLASYTREDRANVVGRLCANAVADRSVARSQDLEDLGKVFASGFLEDGIDFQNLTSPMPLSRVVQEVLDKGPNPGLECLLSWHPLETALAKEMVG